MSTLPSAMAPLQPFNAGHVGSELADSHAEYRMRNGYFNGIDQQLAPGRGRADGLVELPRFGIGLRQLLCIRSQDDAQVTLLQRVRKYRHNRRQEYYCDEGHGSLPGDGGSKKQKEAQDREADDSGARSGAKQGENRVADQTECQQPFQLPALPIQH